MLDSLNIISTPPAFFGRFGYSIRVVIMIF